MNARRLIAPAIVLLAGLGLVACPSNSTVQYDLGYAAGFALDSEYWLGYDDGYDTIGFSPIYYSGGDIPFIDDLSFDAGYYDGIWTAYNDGYFTDYRYAFILGFSEGYDNAFWPDYLDFLENDFHTEYFHGGWIDGYEDGFSEGRVFGAADFEAGLPFDWEDALADYESGTDLYFDEVDVGTGAFGPVVLYEYGFDPLAKTSLAVERGVDAASRGMSIRSVTKGLAEDDYIRPLRQQEAENLNVTPSQSERNNRELRLDTSWLERIESYLGFVKAEKTSVGNRSLRSVE